MEVFSPKRQIHTFKYFLHDFNVKRIANRSIRKWVELNHTHDSGHSRHSSTACSATSSGWSTIHQEVHTHTKHKFHDFLSLLSYLNLNHSEFIKISLLPHTYSVRWYTVLYPYAELTPIKYVKRTTSTRTPNPREENSCKDPRRPHTISQHLQDQDNSIHVSSWCA